jgi:predicted ribosome quality control (RQC) complex YloA/Tae2 family protein
LYDRANASIHAAWKVKSTSRRLDPVGEKQNHPFQLSFDPSLKVDFQGSRVTSDGGLLVVRELDERLGLSALIAENILHARQGKNKQLPLPDLLRQSISRLAGGPQMAQFRLCWFGISFRWRRSGCKSFHLDTN